MGVMQELAHDLHAEERTLRRAAALGTLRCRRVGARRLRLSGGERDYLRSHWPLLSELRQALRTERTVRLAVLYGSAARGDDTADSDVDLLVSLSEDRPDAVMALVARLRRVVGRRVDIARLDRVRSGAPLLLMQALDEGRVLIDRDERWPELQSRRRAIRARAQRAYDRQMQQAASAIAELTER